FNLEMPKPFYVNFGLSREDRTGVTPFSNGNGIEVPQPVDYETTLYSGEIGYQAKPLFAALNFAYSDFTNQNQILYTGSSTGAVTATPSGPAGSALMSLPPDNSVYRLGFKGSLMLPLSSRFSVSLANSHQQSTFDLSQLITPTATTYMSSYTFTGRKDISNYNFSLTSTPVPFLYTKLFYQYYDSENKSDNISQYSGGTTYQIPLFSYKKNNYGASLGFKLPEQFHLDIGYSYLDTDRENRTDIASTKDNVYSAELRWNGLDWLTPKIGYERLERLASYGTPSALSGSISTANPGFFTMFDAAKQGRDTYKAALDASPLDNLNIGVAYKYKQSEYPDDSYGVQNARTNEFEAYGDYGIGNIVKLNAYFDLQNTTENLLDAVYASSTTPPVSTSATNYVWDLQQKDDTFEYGAGVDYYVVPKKLTIRLQYDYVNSDGSDNFGFYYPGPISGVNAASSTIGTPIGNPNLDDNVDSYHKSALTFKTTYLLSKNFSMAAGSSFERYKYNDYGLDSPAYAYYTSTSNILTGAYANPSYSSTVVFLTAAYKF